MEHSEFRIGSTFWLGERRWRCTDVGSRVVVAIPIDSAEVVTWMGNGSQVRRTLSAAEAEAMGWFEGPPYKVAEVVFDEDDLKACSLGSPASKQG